jgi:hypothetical protein
MCRLTSPPEESKALAMGDSPTSAGARRLNSRRALIAWLGSSPGPARPPAHTHRSPGRGWAGSDTSCRRRGRRPSMTWRAVAAAVLLEEYRRAYFRRAGGPSRTQCHCRWTGRWLTRSCWQTRGCPSGWAPGGPWGRPACGGRTQIRQPAMLIFALSNAR